MKRMAISPAASGLLRALMKRADVPRDRILLTDVHSTDWQSLTFAGERHRFGLRVLGSDSPSVVEHMCAGLEDAEFAIAGQIVADVALDGPPLRGSDGSTSITIEALTIGQ